MAAPVSLGSIEGRNVFAGNNFPNASISIGDSKDSQRQPQVCRAIHFPRNDGFVQRSSISEIISRLLPPKAEYQSAALWGLGGSGKTQLALEYAYSRCSDPTCSVFWVHADTETSFAQDYKWIATKLGLADDLDGENLLAAVCNYIETLPQWVFILDNADDLTLFGVRHGQDTLSKGAPNLSKHVPRGPFGTVLWTSRDQRVAGSIVGPRRGIHIVRMTDDEAETLFQALAVLDIREGEEEHANMGRLLAEVGWLPLAITQAAAYIRRTKTSVAEYLTKIQQRKKRWNILKRSEHDPHRRPEVSNSILETWHISMEYIKKENKMAYDILTVLAYVDNQNIPFEMISEIVQTQIHDARYISSSGEPIQNGIDANSTGYSASKSEDDSDPEEDVLEAVARLEEFSFLTMRASKEGRVNRSYDMHKLVQEAISYNLHIQKGDNAEENRSIRTSFEVIEKLFPKKWTHQTWDQCEKYLGHVQRAGDWAQSLDGEGNITQLLSTVSNYLYSRGRWNEKESVDVLTLRLQQAMFGEQNPATIQTLAYLGTAYHNQGRYIEAEKTFVKALALWRDELGDRHPKTISAMGSLAATRHNQGRYKEAEDIYLEVLALRRTVLGDRHPDTVESMIDIGATYHSQGRYNEAEKIKSEALALQRELIGEMHPDTISNMGGLAATYHDQGRYDEAEKLKEQVLALQREVSGDKHPSTAVAMSNLATAYYTQGRYKEAEKMYTEALVLRLDILGDKHPDTVSNRSALGLTYQGQGRYDEAEKTHAEALASRRNILGHKHPDTTKTMAALGSTYHSQGRYDEAEKTHSEALAIRRDVLGDRHPDTISSMGYLASAYHAQGRYQEAEEIKLQVLALRRDVLGDKHPNTIFSMASLAATYHNQGRYDEAKEIDIEVLALQRDVLGDEHPDTIASRKTLEISQRARKRVFSPSDNVSQIAELSLEELNNSTPNTGI